MLGSVLWLSLPFAVVAGLVWALLAPRPRALAAGAIVQPVWLAAGTVLLAAVPHGTGDGTVDVAAVLLTLIAIGLLVVARRTALRELAVGGFLCSGIAAALLFCAIAANVLQFE